MAETVDAGRAVRGRYRPIRALRTGGGVSTTLATDLESGFETVVKTVPLHAVGPATRARLEHEAETLRTVDTAHLAPMIDVGADGDVLYVVAPQVAGDSLADRLADGPLSVAETLTVAHCLLRALDETHRHHIFHRHLKPSDVIVDPRRPIAWAKVVDFGIARSGRVDGFWPGEAVASLRYAAPEQLGLIDGASDERSDLYSVGLILFECLTGGAAHRSATLGELFRQHLVALPRLAEVGVAAPRALDEIVQRLARTDPRDRYQSAAGALADVDAVRRALEGGQAEPSVVVGASDVRRRLSEPAFVGRNAELTALEAELERAQAGSGGVATLEAESGAGKTRLLDELAGLGRRRGILVLRGQATTQASFRPFELLAGVVHGVLAEAAGDPAAGEMLTTRLAGERDALCEVLPELTELLGVPEAPPPGPEAFGEARSLRALGGLLDGLGTSSRPAVVLLDDCQWADVQSIRLLLTWAQDTKPSPRYVSIVVAWRTEEVGAGHPLRGLQASDCLVLRPLGGDAVRELAVSMAGRLPPEAVTVVTDRAAGSPFMAEAVMRGLVEAGALVPLPTGWRFEPVAAADVRASAEAGALLARRLEMLPPATLAVLRTGAILGRAFDLNLAAELADVPARDAIRALDEARRRHLVWAGLDGSRGVFVHDQVREAFLAQVEGPERAGLHRKAAGSLEASDAGAVFDLAYHFHAAGEAQRALPYALRAAERARSQHALDIAEQCYRIALEGTLAGEDTDLRGQVAESLGQVLSIRGSYQEAREHLGFARRLALSPLNKARLEGALGEVAFKQGDMEDAAAAVERALELLGRPVPRRRASVAAALGWELLSRFPGTRRRSASGERDEDVRLVVSLYGRLAYAWWFWRSTPEVGWAVFRQLNLADRCATSPEAAKAYADHAAATVCAWPRLGARAESYATRSLHLRTGWADTWGEGEARTFLGVVGHARGRYAEAVRHCDEALPLLERAGDRWGVANAMWHRALALYRLGELRAAVETSQELYRAGAELGDAQNTANAVDIWSRASGGKVPDELTRDFGSAGGGVQARAVLHVAEAVRLTNGGRANDAAVVLDEARQLMAEHGIRNVYVANVHPWLATAHRHLLVEADPWSRRRRRELGRQAQRSVRRAVWWSSIYPTEAPHARREAGLVAAVRGHPRRARRWLERSLAIAAAQGARHEAALTKEAMGTVGASLGWPDATELRNAAAAELQMLQPPAEDRSEARLFSVVERFDSLLETGNQLASSSSQRAILNAVSQAGIVLLRAETVAVAELEDGGALRRIAGDGPIIRGLVERAMATGRPVSVGDAPWPSDLASEAGGTGALRSALCVPIPVRGEIRACLCVGHRQVGGLFGPDEERLAEFVCGLAGAVMGREQLQHELLSRVIATQEQERARVARDLHDEIGQSLTTVLLGLRLVGSAGERSSPPEDLTDRLAELRDVVTGALNEVRRLAFDLRPSILDNLGLVAALSRLSEDFERRHELVVPLAIEGLSEDQRLPADVETAAFRVIQEALTNVVRHADATVARVTVTRDGPHLRVTVHDDGRGFHVDERRHASLGLRGMGERAALLGGTVEILSSPGEGTSVVFEVPLG